VNSWRDSSGLSHDATLRSVAPVYKTNVSAGLPGVAFASGTGSGLGTALNSTTMTFFGVVVTPFPLGETGSLIGSGARGGLQIQLASAHFGGIISLVGESSLNIGSSTRSLPTGAQLVELTYDSASRDWRLYLDGVVIAAG